MPPSVITKQINNNNSNSLVLKHRRWQRQLSSRTKQPLRVWQRPGKSRATGMQSADLRTRERCALSPPQCACPQICASFCSRFWQFVCIVVSRHLVREENVKSTAGFGVSLEIRQNPLLMLYCLCVVKCFLWSRKIPRESQGSIGARLPNAQVNMALVRATLLSQTQSFSFLGIWQTRL